ncbi:MAG TPA: phosphoglycerate dehydrogenase [Clostridiales bacterium]|nr:phosphoglycerate dehydrogenase [Clostridiales bacterium]
MKKVLVTATNYSKYCREGKQLLLDYGCEIIENPYGYAYPREELKRLVRDIHGAVVGIDSWDEELFKLAPNLQAIARFGVGVDNIDLEGAKEHGVIVSNCPGINTSAVAELALGLMLSLTRRIPALNEGTRRGEWARPMTHELKSQTVGLLGFGAIARNLAGKLKPFGARMIAYDKFPDQQSAGHLGVELMCVGRLLEESDIISIHIPATDETRGFINDETIAGMKPGVYIVNTARSSIVDERALYRGLKSGKIAGYGTDVLDRDPASGENPLLEFPECIVTPYTAAETYENYAATGIATAQALISVFNGEEPRNRLA